MKISMDNSKEHIIQHNSRFFLYSLIPNVFFFLCLLLVLANLFLEYVGFDMLFIFLKFQGCTSGSFQDIRRNIKNWKCPDTFGRIVYIFCFKKSSLKWKELWQFQKEICTAAYYTIRRFTHGYKVAVQNNQKTLKATCEKAIKY